MTRVLLLFTILFYHSFVFAEKFSHDASYQVCFTPSQECTSLIVAAINRAQTQVLLQAYSFTSVPIAKALVQAHKKGVEVKVILDKSQYRDRGFSSAKFFSDYHIPVLIDYKPSIAHNKVIIIDHKTVVTGSFNFTKAAEERNAENVIIITDDALTKRYLTNWEQRAKESIPPQVTHSPFD